MKASVFALAVLWTGALFAQAPAPPEHAAHIDRLATLLDLSDAQKTQVQAILQEERRQTLARGSSGAQMKKFETVQELHGEMMHAPFGHGGPPGPAPPPPAHN